MIRVELEVSLLLEVSDDDGGVDDGASMSVVTGGLVLVIVGVLAGHGQ